MDQSEDAVLELAKKYAELEHDAKGAWAGGKLPLAHPCPDRKDPVAPTENQPKER